MYSGVKLQLDGTIMADTVLSKALQLERTMIREYIYANEGQQWLDIVQYFLLGLNWISRVVEGIAHDICEGVVQFSEHLWRRLISTVGYSGAVTQPGVRKMLITNTFIRFASKSEGSLV